MRIKTSLALIAVLALMTVAFIKGCPLALPNGTKRFPSPDGKRAVVLSVDYTKQSPTFRCIRLTVVNDRGEVEFQRQTSDPYYYEPAVTWNDDKEIYYVGSKSSFIVLTYINSAWMQSL